MQGIEKQQKLNKLIIQVVKKERQKESYKRIQRERVTKEYREQSYKRIRESYKNKFTKNSRIKSSVSHQTFDSAAIYFDITEGLLGKVRRCKPTMPFGAAIAYVTILVNGSINVLIPKHFASGVDFTRIRSANPPVCPFGGRERLPAFIATAIIPAFECAYHYLVRLCVSHTPTIAFKYIKHTIAFVTLSFVTMKHFFVKLLYILISF